MNCVQQKDREFRKMYLVLLVRLLHRAIPKEMFDPNSHAMDTTYLDADLRIVRLTGAVHEGVRNIFMRQGTIVINPVGPA
eukprot:CCRYP_006409-RA/>CCRYP_006409-RA protein AED:0.28 eAED:0.28 QI:0/0/0.5/1/0/0/2/571/79